MPLAGLALSVILVLGLTCTASARSAYRSQDDGAPPQFASVRAHDAKARSEKYPLFPTELVETQQEQCMGKHVPVDVPYVNVDVCSATPKHCGWVKLDIRGLRGGMLTADVRVCDREYYAIDLCVKDLRC